jgi:hypothetical protein
MVDGKGKRRNTQNCESLFNPDKLQQAQFP